MSNLPKVVYPYFDAVLPSTGQKIKYRPYSVAEEKILLVASESGDIDQIKTAIKQVIGGCVKDAPPIEDWAIFDVEQIYLKVRSKALSNTVDIQVRLATEACTDKDAEGLCKTINIQRIDLDAIKLMVQELDGTYTDYKPSKKSGTIPLSEELGVELRYPTYDDIEVLKDLPTADGTEDEVGYRMLARCTKSVFDKEAVYDAKENTQAELIEFYKSLPRNQLELADNFFKRMPKVYQKCDMVCRKCKGTASIEFEGIENFFA